MRLRKRLPSVQDGPNIAYALAGEVIRPALPTAQSVGDKLMAGKAAKHVASLGRQLVIVGDPRSAVECVSAAVEGSGRFTAVSPEGAEPAAWAAESAFGPYPRIALFPSPGDARRTVFGVERFVWRMRFPQGSGFFDRALKPAIEAVAAAGLESSEGAATFEFSGAPDDGAPEGEWRLSG